MHAAKDRMVHDVEEFGAELQHAGFSQEPQFCVLHQRKIPISFGRPVQDIARGSAKLTNRVWIAIAGKRIYEEAGGLLRVWTKSRRRQREHCAVEPIVGVAGNNLAGV